jgi:methyltransferase (TIGR00027 family)
MRHDVAMGSEPNEPLGGVSDTALGAAEMRAEASRRPDRLIDDPYAAAFVDAAPPLFADVPSVADDSELAALVESGVVGVAIRTRFFDDRLLDACAAGCRQVVLLAAGLDTRAFRLDWPDGVELFEVDLPELFAFKEPVLAAQNASPKCDRRVVLADLRDDWPTRLVTAGFDPDRSTIWIAEGLLVYLSNDAAARLLGDVGDLSAPGSQLSFDDASPGRAAAPGKAECMVGMEEIAEMWKGGLEEDSAKWLDQRGWNVETFDRTVYALKLGRTLADPTGRFLTATRAP